MHNFLNYLLIENIGGARWHHNKDHLVFAYDSPGNYQVFSGEVVKSAKLWPTRLTFLEDRCTNPRYLSDGSIVFSTDEGGNENFQIGLIQTDNSIFILSQDTGAKYNLNTSSKNFLYYSSNFEDKAKFKLYRHRIPLLENEPEELFNPNEGLVSISTVNSDETIAVITNSYSNTHSELILINLQTKETALLTATFNKHEQSIWTAVRLIDDGILVYTNHASDFYKLAYLGFDGGFGHYKELEDRFQVEFQDTTYNSNDEFTYFSINNQGYSEIYRGKFNKNDVSNIQKLNLPQNTVLLSGDQRSFTNSMDLNYNNSLLAITCSGANYPSNLYIIDVKSNRSWQVSEVSTPGLNEDKFADATLHKFNSFDGLEVPYFRFLPLMNSEKPENGWPTLLIIHGGPEAQMTPSFSGILQFFLSAGFALVTPNIRGSAGYGRTYMDLDNKEKRLDSIKDIAELARYLNANDKEIDGDKLFVYGGSYGGFAVLSCLVEHPNLWKGGVDIVGISSFTTFLKNTAAWRRKLRESEYGSLEDDYEMLESISPINKIENIKVPLFIIQGDNDERVPLSESIQMYEKLREKGLNVELLRFEDEGHGIVKLKNKLVAYPRVITWLQNLI